MCDLLTGGKGRRRSGSVVFDCWEVPDIFSWPPPSQHKRTSRHAAITSRALQSIKTEQLNLILGNEVERAAAWSSAKEC
jgi:hypothetical protein